ncbi:MAG: TIGR03790 family protein [Tepidisphaeraceae bacterium]|jgi:uncharacterized protein (TIGR03790 family)
MIRPNTNADVETIYSIINEAAEAYRGVIGDLYRRIVPIIAGCLSISLGVAGAVLAQDVPAAAAAMADRVVVVCNEKSPISKAIADDYAKRRGVRNVVTVACQDSAIDAKAETIAFTTYQKQIEVPLRAFLAGHPGIDFIVLTKGVPIRLAGLPDRPGDPAPGRGGAPQEIVSGRLALDSYLAALDYEKLPGAIKVDITDPNYSKDFHGLAWANRYWNSNEPFSHAKFGGYLVTRLDGYTEADAKALTTRSLAAEEAARSGKRPEGKILLDVCPGFGLGDPAEEPHSILPDKPVTGMVMVVTESPYHEFNADMRLAAQELGVRGIPVELETTAVFAGNMAGLAGYVSWGSNDQKFDAAAYHSLGFAPGAVCDTAVSTSARTFLPTKGGQSLITDLIAHGVTGVKGYTDEPLLQAIASPSILFRRYTGGGTLAESFYAASRFVGWQDIVIGDPLCRPYAPVAR